MKNDDFVEVSAFIRVLEKRLLGNAGINRLLETPGAVETLRQISQNSEYDFAALARPEDYENVVRAELKRVYTLIRKLVAPNDLIVDAAAAKHDFHNIKTAVKANIAGPRERRAYSAIPLLDPAILEAYVTEDKHSDDIPDYVREAVASAKGIYTESGDPGDIDIVLDNLMFAHTLELCGVIGSDFITEYVRLSIDFHNIKTLMRVKNMRKGTRFLRNALAVGGNTDTEFFITHYDKSPDAIAAVFFYRYFGDLVKKGVEDYNKSSNFSTLERLFDDRLIDHIRKAKLIAFGPEIPFAYLISKENEARQIRLLAACKLNGIQPDGLRERLRDNYA